MTFLIQAEVLEASPSKLLLKDLRENLVISCVPKDDSGFEFSPGDTGIFFGTFNGSDYVVSKANVMKFLHPLYEEDILEKSGKYQVLNLIEDPYIAQFEELKGKKVAATSQVKEST